MVDFYVVGVLVGVGLFVEGGGKYVDVLVFGDVVYYLFG